METLRDIQCQGAEAMRESIAEALASYGKQNWSPEELESVLRIVHRVALPAPLESES